MVGETNYGKGDAQNWLQKANPDELVTHATQAISKIAAMDPATQDKFVQQLRSNPQAARLFERVTTG